MNRSSLLLTAIMVLALTGSAFAQTAPGDAVQPGTANSEPGTSPPMVQGDSPETQAGSPPSSDATATPSAQPTTSASGGAEADPASLPATASSNPLMFGVGVLALVAFVTLLLYRRHRTARS